MSIDFGREICGELNIAESREWLVTNGLGSYASGTVTGLSTRGYHGLLVAALKPPTDRTLLVTKLDETGQYDGRDYPLFTNRWGQGDVDPQAHGYAHIERFYLEGKIPVWNYVFGDALLEKRIWMQPGQQTTYIHYHLQRGSQPLTLTLKALVNYRSYHGRTEAGNWHMNVETVSPGIGIKVTAFNGATPFYVMVDPGDILSTSGNDWYRNFELARERDRGLNDHDDSLHAATFQTTLGVGETLTVVASTKPDPDLDGMAALQERRDYEQGLLTTWQTAHPDQAAQAPDWVKQLVLSADQFIVDRPVLPDNPDGKSVIAGYHWFTDWGRDTMISLPGLTLATGRPEIAKSIIKTFANYIDRGMLPNRFPDDGSRPDDSEYNTVDATLWYFEAIRSYYEATGDDDLLAELFPKLADIIEQHRRGTRYNIHLDPADNLIYAGDPTVDPPQVQLTWMDAKVGHWVVTPRIGKPVEVNALWYNALHTMSKFARQLNKPHQEYDDLAQKTKEGFQRFWNEEKGYCFDVLDGPGGRNDPALRPNQLFAVSLPESPLDQTQQRQVLDVCGRILLTSHGLRSLSPDDPAYKGVYGGDQTQRDSAYHQGTVWGWLIGPFVLAHLRVFNNPAQARQFLAPMAHHLVAAGLGSISEVFEGDAPMQPRGCIAQAWSAAEVLRAWLAIEKTG